MPKSNGWSLSARRAWIEMKSRQNKNPLLKRSLSARRAWIEIMIHQKKAQPGSLSARRAWIEMLSPRLVDMSAAWSLSARRAWIEILRSPFAMFRLICVALRKESVDRNC